MLRSFFHWKVITNLLLALGVFTGLVWLTFRWLEFHTNHGEETAVPNVVNMTVQQAIEVLDDQGLDYEVDSFKFDPKFKPYQVLKISPLPGSHVKDGRTIVLKVNPKTWAPVAVPDVIDRYKYLAFRKLTLLGLKVGDTLYEPNIQKDAVIRMMYNGVVIKPGAKVPMFSSLDLVIGSGPLRNVTIPNLVGLTVGEAKAIIGKNYFEMGVVEHEDGGNDDSDIIYYQDPGSGSARDQGMQVDVWASKKTPAEMMSKIKELDAIYKPVDVNVPSTSEGDVMPPPEQTPAPAPEIKKPQPTTKPQADKPVVKSNTKPAENKSTDTKPASTNSSVKKPAETKPAEQKPAKNVIVE